MHNLVLVLSCCLIGSVLTKPNKPEVTILKYDSTNDGLGSYIYNVETSDGTKKREEGVFVKSDDPEKDTLRVTGFFSYVGPDGVTYTVKYIADENGFQPEGDHLPKDPNSPDPTVEIQLLSIPAGAIASLLG
ncbi:endocuticle structural protein SgAbd-6-like [Arctopsyche grandis]|uniref:endocuticle structural protein SgAbd-6-like n=1 Tax=Arctopsyche grandis TaxID=121162 RepID=UPI00406D9429